MSGSYQPTGPLRFRRGGPSPDRTTCRAEQKRARTCRYPVGPSAASRWAQSGGRLVDRHAVRLPVGERRARRARDEGGRRSGTVHRRLEVLFWALEEAGVEWTLLRLPRDLQLPPGDVDLLVRPRDLAPFSAAAREAGFVGL